MASTRLPLAALLLCLTASVVSAQSPSMGCVSGRVLDPIGLPLAGVAVTAKGPASRDTRLNHSAPAVDLTLGGPLVRDRLFFFGAAQFERSEQNRTLPYTGINYTCRDRQQRYQAKITWTPILKNSVGNDLSTYSAFASDTWRVSARF